MVPPTRRALLYGAAGLTTALAGCSGLFNASAESTRTASHDDSDGARGSRSVMNPEALLLRVDTDRPPIWIAESDGETGNRSTANDRDRWRDSMVVDDSTRADRISVADSVDRDRVESFLTATSFEAETVYIEMGAVAECFRLDLCHISWTETEISTEYTRQTRSYTERCGVDEWVIEARLIRIPDAIEADSVTSYSSSVGTGPCDQRQGRAESETGETDSSSAGENDDRTETPTADSGGDQ